MKAAFEPTDQETRRRIRGSLDETLFVEAGAGTGKTTSMVERVVELVSRGHTTISRLAAITFTESAAAELRDRIREELEKAASNLGLDEGESRRCRQGVRDLDQASIQTLHSFAANLLRERPLEAGLPPGFDIIEGIAADLAFEEEWSQWLDMALDDADLVPSLRLALSLGMSLSHLRGIAQAFHREYDRLEGHSFDDPSPGSASAVADLIEAAGELERLRGFADLGDEDNLVMHLNGVLGAVRRLEGLDQGSPEAYRLLVRMLPIRSSVGRMGDWRDDPSTGENACRVVKSILAGLDKRVRDELEGARQIALMPLLRALQGFAIGYALKRKQRGVAEFHDLLVWARDLLRDDLEVRDHFRERFTHLLIDEAQDTDPLQAEIALFLSEAAPSGSPDRDRPRRWTDVRPQQGKLFVVGDPKQSIYRFRRADVGQMARLQRLMGGETVRLVQNFRSQRPIIEWVNHVFRLWMEGQAGQSAYVPLVHRWDAATDHRLGPRVWHMGSSLEETRIGVIRRIEAQAIASLLRAVPTGEWQVLDARETQRAHTEQYRAARYSDVCILMPRRTSLPTLELALEQEGIPFRLEGAALIFATQEIRDLVNCLRAIDDPADQVSLVAALRSPAFACSDEDLLDFVERGGVLDCLAEDQQPGGPIPNALAELRSYHEARLWLSIAALIERFVRERQLVEAALGRPRPREQWRRYRFLVEQSRAFAEAGGGSLRAFLEWAERQADEGARVTEVPVPETDEDAVRVMTVHGAKGLEFPIVVLTGLNGSRPSGSNTVLFDRETGGIEVRVGSRGSPFRTPGHEALAAREREMEEQEFIRLLYVATTRARDHLVLSMFRPAGKNSAAARIAALMEGHDHLWEPAPEMTPLDGGLPIPARLEDPHAHDLEARDRWWEGRRRLLRDRSRPVAVAATTLARVAKEETTSEEPWRRGRGGTSLGRAVHAVLQTVDLETGAGLRETARAQATAEGIPHRETEVVRLAQVALESAVVGRAVASQRIWREVPVAVPVGDGVLEGFVDLLFQEAEGLVIVDYKTDVLERDETGDAAQRYRLQAGAYTLAVRQATGLPVKEVVFLFLQPRREESLTDIALLTEEARTAALEHLGSAVE